MNRWKFGQTIDLKSGSGEVIWPNALMLEGDNEAHEWRVAVRDGGKAVDVGMYGITAYFQRADGKTVIAIGAAEGDTATVVLPQSAYAIPGQLLGVMRASVGESHMTLAAGRWTVRNAPDGEYVDPGRVVPGLPELLDRIAEMENAAENANRAATSASSAAQAADEARAGIQGALDSLKGDINNLFVSDEYFNYFMFGELAKVEMNWDFTQGDTASLTCDNPDAPDFIVFGTPRFNENGVSAHSYRGKDYLELDISFLKGKSWEMDIWTADYNLTTEKITSNDIPITLLAEGVDSPGWIVYTSSDLGDNGYALHQYAMNKFGGYKRETEYSVLNRRFRFVRSAENGTLRCLLMRIDADGNEEITIDRTITTDVEPGALRLCNDAAVLKGCMLPISALRISYLQIPKEA